MKKQLFLILTALVLAVGLSGCQKEVMPAPAPPNPTLTVGETQLVDFSPPVEGATGTLVKTEPDQGLVASYDAANRKLTLTGQKPGDYTLGLNFTAKGYQDQIVYFPVSVELPILEAELNFVNISMDRGMTVFLMVTSPVEGYTLDIASDSPCVAIDRQGEQIAAKGVDLGRAVVSVTASHPDYRSRTLECTVDVYRPPVPLSVADGIKLPVTVVAGKTTVLPLVYEGSLTLSVPDGLRTVVGGERNQLVVTGVTPGDYTLTITASQEGCKDSQLEVPVTVTPAPKVEAKPETGNTTPAMPGDEPAKAASQPDVREDRYANLEKQILQAVNEERTSRDIPELAMVDVLCQAAALRAKETAEDTSHTRPDGRRGLTVFADFGVNKYTIKGENLAGKSDVEDGYQVVQRWMNSPSHKAALLDERFSETGIGVYFDGEVYRYCQLFGGVTPITSS